MARTKRVRDQDRIKKVVETASAIIQRGKDKYPRIRKCISMERLMMYIGEKNKKALNSKCSKIIGKKKLESIERKLKQINEDTMVLWLIEPDN